MANKMSDRNRWALLIGINHYASAPSLQGCANDVKLMSTILQRFGFLAENVIQLLDAQATRGAILSRLEELMKRAASAAKSPSFLDSLVSAFKDLLDRDDPYATVVLYFSGWGVRVVPETGQDPSQIAANVIMPWTPRPSYRTKKVSMPEGMMSALVPYDWREELPQSAITYHEIRDWLSRLLPITPNITVILDAPYAGTLLSGIARADGKQPVFMGACRTDELCYETSVGGGTYQGVFTYILGQALLRAEPSTTCRDVFKDVSAQVPARWPYQHPQIEGDLARMVFGTSQAERKRISGMMRFVTVAQREKDWVTLGAGAANGVTVKSLWMIYPQETQQVTEQTPKLGVVEISLVTADRAEAEILSEAAAEAIQAGAQAVEEAHYYGEMRLAVKIEAPTDFERNRGELIRQLRGSELLRFVEGEDPADVTVHILLPRSEAADNDPVPELQRITEPCWCVVALPSSRLALFPLPVGDPSATYLLRDKLEKMARYRNVLGLRNPNLNSPLVGKVEFLLRRQDPGGLWTPAEADRQSGVPVFREGDRLGLEIINRHTEPIYASVFAFSLARTISLLYPRESAQERIMPGQVVRVGMEPDKRSTLVVYVPDDVPVFPDSEDVEQPVGLETFKLFATTYPTDMGLLFLQEGSRGVFSSLGENTALWQLLDMALTGRGSRERRLVSLPPEQEWTTVERAIALRRR